MSDTQRGLRRKIDSASDLASVVGTMKTMAASNVSRYASAVESLEDYYATVEIGLIACLRDNPVEMGTTPRRNLTTGAVVFGSDQGLVGRFNRSLAEEVAQALGDIPGDKEVWAIGERMAASLSEVGLPVIGVFSVPNSVQAITSLVGQIQVEVQAHRDSAEYPEVHVFHNRQGAGAGYRTARQRLLPLDDRWRDDLLAKPWPGPHAPEVIESGSWALPALIREYLFVSLFRACAESLMSENASRLAAMQRAQKNIDKRVAQLGQTFNRMRQSAIDEELFDVISGYESLSTQRSLLH